jgi:peptide/nickel transport system ATP-binding protein
MTALVELRDLAIRFGGMEVVRGVSLSLARGRTLALVGESGSGKTLTAMSLAGLAPPAARLSGSLRFEGQEMMGAAERDWRRLHGARIGVVFQEAMGSLNPTMRIGAQIAEAVRVHGRGLGRDAVQARVRQLLEEVGLPDPAGKAAAFPHQLSGGQQQRALIAMALAGDPDLLIADEPTTALDATVQAQILRLLAGLQRRRGLAMLFVSHDLGVVAEIADEIVVMRGGTVVEAGPAHRILAAPAHPYTRALLASRPASGIAPPAAARAEHAALVAEDLVVVFRSHGGGRQAFRALDGVSLRLEPGAALGVVGGSGSGKSTLGRAALGLLAPAAGRIRVFGEDPVTPKDRRGFARRAQMVFQDAAGSLNPRLRVAVLLAEPLVIHALCPRAGLRDRAAALLAEVGLEPAHLDRYPHELSGGQRQRVAIARALAVDPGLLVCDEPVSALDMTVQAQILALLNRIRRERGLALLFIGHDFQAVEAVSDRIAVMSQGRIVEEGSAAQIFREPRTEQSRALVEAMPARSRASRPRPDAVGELAEASICSAVRSP